MTCALGCAATGWSWHAAGAAGVGHCRGRYSPQPTSRSPRERAGRRRLEGDPRQERRWAVARAARKLARSRSRDRWRKRLRARDRLFGRRAARPRRPLPSRGPQSAAPSGGLTAALSDDASLMRTLELDFAPARVRLAGCILLGLAVVCATVLGLSYRALVQEIEAN